MFLRRRLAFFAGVVAAGALFSAAACGGGDDEAAPAEGVKASGTLDFVVWSYSIETIQDNIKRFEKANPAIQIKLADHSWFDYHDIMATKFTSGNAPDVAYSSDHWLREWVAAGWLEPIDERCPQLAQYKGEWAPYAAEGMTLDDKLYGVPYYADLVIFIYNDQMVKQAGFSGPPQTLAELQQPAVAMKQKGSAHSTVGFVRFYSLGKGAVDQGDAAVKASCKFMNYFGGKTGGQYKVMKRWALEKGLGFANLPLYDDPQVQQAINKWGDVALERKQAQLARVKEGLTPWWGAWDIYAREQIHAAILGRSTPTQALQKMADRWEQLRKQHGG